MLLRRLSLSRADKPRKRYEGYDADAKKDNGGLDHWSVGSWAGSGGRTERSSTIGGAGGGAQGFVGAGLSFDRGSARSFLRCALGSVYGRSRALRFGGETRLGGTAAQPSDPASADTRSRRIAP